jgi:hypothetical protein
MEANKVRFSVTVIVGIVLVILGMIALTYQGITYTRQKRIPDVGPIHATEGTRENITLTPIVGSVALVGGILLLVVCATRSLCVSIRGHDKRWDFALRRIDCRLVLLRPIDTTRLIVMGSQCPIRAFILQVAGFSS